jgi:KipI family sensor histidine kinase inhibitor
VPVGEIRPLGDHAFVIGVADAIAARRLAQAITEAERTTGRDHLREVVGGAATVMVALDPEVADVEALRPVLESLAAASVAPAATEAVATGHGAGAARLVEVPCVFDGPDLAEVASTAGCSPDEVVRLLTSSTLSAAFLGFSPGFAYLEGLPDALAGVPRRPHPRPAVAPGSVALANGYAAVYPTASPGGWQLVGRTALSLFDPHAAPYATLAPGDRVRFTVVQGASQAPTEWPPATPDGTAPALLGTAAFVVEEPGLRCTFQDGGRRGIARLGVPAAGPADPDALRLANRLVGNASDAAALEITARGPTLRVLRPGFVAVVGADPVVRLDGQPLAPGRVTPVAPEQRLVVGEVRGGLRTYVAVAGAFDAPTVMGSCATDDLCGLGPGPLVAGMELRAGALRLPLGDHLADGVVGAGASGGAGERGTADRPITLRVLPGPHAERFARDALEVLVAGRYVVDAASNRVGLRLRTDPSAAPLRRDEDAPAELDSQGMMTGAIQVPPSGEPVVLLGDHATLGGYPVLAVVATVDHGMLGQCAPGKAVAFTLVTAAQAAAALSARRRRLEAAVIGHYPVGLD